MGAFFLLLFIEITRTYCVTEKANAEKSRLLPYDRFWTTLGQLTNMWCCMWSVAAMPVLFFTEMDAKDIVYDSLGMLFLFSLDDIAGDAFHYLALDDDAFQMINGWTVAALSQCPRIINDIVNPDAEHVKDIWQIRIGKDGLLSSSGKQCKTRLMEVSTVDESTPLADVSVSSTNLTPWASRCFEYSVCHTGTVSSIDSRKLSLGICLWTCSAIVLLVAEFIVPVVFLIVNNPCADASKV